MTNQACLIEKEDQMATRAGVWIDQTKAVVLLISDDGDVTKQFSSNAEVPSPPRNTVPEDTLKRKHAARLKTYFDEVITYIRDAEEILIFGPGEAKREFAKRIKSKKLPALVAEPETVDQMTDRQIAAKVRKHFSSGPDKGDGTQPARKR